VKGPFEDMPEGFFKPKYRLVGRNGSDYVFICVGGDFPHYSYVNRERFWTVP
jgi:hypothetical protein